MKKYILFVFEDYYPCGGLDDIEDDFDRLGDALEAGKKREGPFTNWYVVDRDTWEIVAAELTEG